MLPRLVREDAGKAIAYFALFAANAWLVVSLYPELETKIPAFSKLLPKSLGGLVSDALTAGFPGFLLVHHSWKAIDLFSTGFAVLLGVGFLARDRETGVIEYHLSLPISRTRLFWTRWTWALAVFTAPPFAATALLLALAPTIGETAPAGPLYRATALGVAAASVSFSLAILLGTLLREQARVAGWSAGVAAALLLLSLFPETAPYTPFRWNLPTRLLPLLRDAPFPWSAFLTLTGISGALTAAAFVSFRRADL
jgi:ABC-type transport system involved in multi-copper enzyme maturation permease subunit